MRTNGGRIVIKAVSSLPLSASGELVSQAALRPLDTRAEMPRFPRETRLPATGTLRDDRSIVRSRRDHIRRAVSSPRISFLRPFLIRATSIE